MNKSGQNQPITHMQSQNNFFEAQVPPLSFAKSITLPGGKYSLGADSTIPFVSLQGGGSSQKVFTWGEFIEVPAGQKIQVKNESFMVGDIQINSGTDYSNKPGKISLPVETDTVIGTAFTTITPRFPADTRLCKRAYLNCQLLTNVVAASAVQFTAIGKPIKHSYPATDTVTGINNYLDTYALNLGTSYSYLPLGFGFEPGLENVMGLTDQVTWSLRWDHTTGPGPIVINKVFFYVLEY